jgi:hypothetical protein
VRRGRPGQRGGKPGGGRGGGRGPRRTDTDTSTEVELPRTDEQGVSAEGREQPVITPEVEETPKAVADAPDEVVGKKQTEDPTKLDDSGGEG